MSKTGVIIHIYCKNIIKLYSMNVLCEEEKDLFLEENLTDYTGN